MPNGEYIEIMSAISAVHSDLLKEVGQVKDRLGKLEGFSDRVKDIEDEQKSATRRQWWHSTVLIPLMTAIHAILQHFGIKV